MKITKLFCLILICFIFFSCDDFLTLEDGDRSAGTTVQEESEEEETVEEEQAEEKETEEEQEKPSKSQGEPDFLYFFGERLEKYSYEIEPSCRADLVSPEVLGVALDPVPNWPQRRYGYNQVTLRNVPLATLFVREPISLSASGTFAVRGISSPDYIAAYSLPFTASLQITPYSSSVMLVDPYSSLVSFSSDSINLNLPKTSFYFSTKKITKNLYFSIPISSDTLKSLQTESYFTAPGFSGGAGSITYTLTDYYPTDILCSAFVDVNLLPVSRDFYQYTTVTFAYPPNISISDIKPSSIVESYDYDKDSNSVTVIFNDYDEPYSGTVLSFKIKEGEKGTTYNKTISIDG